MDYLKSFLIGGAICLVGQLLIDKTKLTPARILVSYVVAGVILGAVGLYAPFAEFAGAGAAVPLTGFGNTLAKGVREAVDERRQQVRAAGAGVAAHDHAIAEAADDAARDGRKDRARAGSRMVLKRREVDIIQRQQHDGKHDCKRRGQHGIAVVYDIIRQQDERDVDEDRHIADLKMEHMLDDGRDARQAGRRELVGEHEEVVAQGKQTGAEHDDQIILHSMPFFHWKSLPGLISQARTPISY